MSWIWVFDCLEVTEQIMLDFLKSCEKNVFKRQNRNDFAKLAHILAGKMKKKKQFLILTFNF